MFEKECETALVPVKPGHWVTSTQGRDRGMHYLVRAVLDDRFIEVVDGVRRTPARPKKKSLRHVWVRDVVHEELGRKFASGARVTGAEIEAALQELVRGEDEEVG